MSAITTEQREMLRLQLLKIANDCAPFGASNTIFADHLRARRIPFDKDRLPAEIAYLVDKQLLSPVQKTISPENQAHAITAAGMDFLAANGFE